MIRAVILAAFASAAFAASPLPAQAAVPGDAASARTVSRDDAEHDAAARAAGLVPLRSTRLPAGTREVRYWYDFGLGYPHTLYRLVERGSRITGEIVFYWPVAEPDTRMGERTGETYADLVRESNRGRCGDFTIEGDTEACRGRFTREPDWRAVLGRAAAAGLWTLPDQSTLPDDRRITLDGWGMTVELRAGLVRLRQPPGTPGLAPGPAGHRRRPCLPLGRLAAAPPRRAARLPRSHHGCLRQRNPPVQRRVVGIP
jgi:hypothetical protein